MIGEKVLLPSRIWRLTLLYRPRRQGDIFELSLHRTHVSLVTRYSYVDERGRNITVPLVDSSLSEFQAIRSLIRGHLIGVRRTRRLSCDKREFRVSDPRYDTRCNKLTEFLGETPCE